MLLPLLLPPIALVVDLDVIRDAPVRYVRSGIGDAISNLSAIADWELSHRENGEKVVFDAVVRIDTPGEADYYRNGGILQYVLRNMIRG